MAYLCITDSCRNGRCDDCTGGENIPPRGSFICGGGICVHSCHGGHDPKLEANVAKYYETSTEDTEQAED